MGEARKIPEHEAIYGRIREMILFGELVPGQPVTIQGLCDETSSGMTPVREALRRLTTEGALLAKGNRRIEVPELSISELEEIYFARFKIEPELAELALKRADPGLAERLRLIDEALNQAIEQGDVESYLRNNYRFHFALYGASGAEILLSLVRSLWLRAGPSLRVVCGRLGTANLPDKHEAAISALRNGQAEALATAIHEDLEQGLEQIRGSRIFA